MERTIARIKLFISRTVILVFLASILYSCSNNCSDQILDIHVSSPGNNTLKIEVEVHTLNAVDVSVKYWPKGRKDQFSATPVSRNLTLHKLILTNLKAKQEYNYQVVISGRSCSSKSKEYSFATTDYQVWMKDVFKVVCPDTSVVPKSFRDGYVMLYRRENPGILFFLNSTGAIEWYHQVNGTGFKAAHFTDSNSILSILGTDAYEASYGNEILELSLTGDTTFHLLKGEKGLQQTIHHEIRLNRKNQIITLTESEKVYDLRSRGGGQTDTVKSDGILVLDRKGNKVWEWSVFDVVNPLDDKDILKNKNDWTHANSLSFDKDGNYIISFYNTGQVWKVDASTGHLVWKFGKEGDFQTSKEGIFDEGHAVHFNKENNLMLFNNGTSNHVSRIMTFHMDEQTKKAELVLNMSLPPELYSERMGSAYIINDSTILNCSSKKHTVVLTNFKGTFLWLLQTGFMPYRAEFIPAERLLPYIKN